MATEFIVTTSGRWRGANRGAEDGARSFRGAQWLGSAYETHMETSLPTPVHERGRRKLNQLTWAYPRRFGRGSSMISHVRSSSSTSIEGIIHYMTAKLTKELAAALHATGKGELEVVDPETSQLYFIVDCETHRRAMEALRRQQDREAIAQGIAEMEAGQGMPLAEAFNDIRSNLGLRQRQQ